MNEMPDIGGIGGLPPEAPRAIVACMGLPEGIFSLDNVDKLRVMLGEVKSGIGEVSDDGLFTFMAVDIASKGDGEPHFYPYSHSIHPGTITSIREMTEGFWKSMTAQWKPDKPRPGFPPGVEVIQGVGVHDFLSSIGLNLPGVKPPKARGEDTTHEGIPAVRDEVEDTKECCCGHAASAHGDAQKFVGACMVEGCSCNLFHTHEDA